MTNWFEKRMKELGYKGCRNCKYQIEPLRNRMIEEEMKRLDEEESDEHGKQMGTEDQS